MCLQSYTARDNLEELWAPNVHHTEKGTDLRRPGGENLKTQLRTGEQVLWYGGWIVHFWSFFPFHSLLLYVCPQWPEIFSVLDDAACLDLEPSKATGDNLNLTLNFIFLTWALTGNNNESEIPVDQPKKRDRSVLTEQARFHEKAQMTTQVSVCPCGHISLCEQACSESAHQCA